MKVNVYFCNECHKYFLLKDKHVKNGRIQAYVDCDVCGSKLGGILIRDVNMESRNWVLADGLASCALDEGFMSLIQQSGDSSDLEFCKWIESHKDSFVELDMDAVREVCK